MTPPTHACVFDAFGTLFNTHSPMQRLHERIGERAGEISAIWRQKQLEYTWLRSLMGEYVDFEQITAEALDHALRRCGIGDPLLYDELLSAYRQLDCYPEVPAVLKTLKEQGYSVAILTNGTEAMMRACIEYNDIGRYIDDILSADQLRIYKPSPRVYELAIDRFGPPVPGILFQSANAWDIAGAAYFGFTCTWINRSGAVPETLPGTAAHELPDLDGLPQLLADNAR